VTVAAGLPSDAELAQRSARIRLPGWLAGGNLQEFGRTCRWRIASANSADGKWDVRLDERVKRTPGRLVQVNRLATRDNADKAGAYSWLCRLPREAALFKDVDYGHVQSEINRLGEQRPDDLATLMYRVTLATGTAAPDQLAEIVCKVLRDFLLPVLPNAAAYLVEINLALGRRYGLVRLLRQAEDDETMFLRPPVSQAGEPLFNSARWLFSDTSLGLDAYLAPLFLALAPWAWAAPAKRPGGVVIYTFGCLAAGRRSEAAELLQLFFPEGRAQSGPKPEVSPADIHGALNWWTEALDRLFTEVTDPARYVGDDGQYSVKDNFEALLSLEQAFRNVQSLSAQARDNHVRRTLLFDTLDTLEGLRKPDFAKMCELGYAQRVLDEVTGLLSMEAGRVLLPRAKRAVAALQQLQNGFFAPSRLRGSGLRVPNKNGNGERVVTFEAAAGSYLRVLRNGGHAFGGRTVPADGVYLMAHDGEIPIDLPDLAYLYLLDLLAHPQVLRRRTTPGRAAGT
jgi:hypothetical protein